MIQPRLHMFEPTHVLSEKSARQKRNVFIWCNITNKLAMGLHVDNDSPITISTVYRWITATILGQYSSWQNSDSYALFPVDIRTEDVLLYGVHKRADSIALPRDSQDFISPGDYAYFGEESLYVCFPSRSNLSFSKSKDHMDVDSPLLAAKSLLTPDLIQEALNRDNQCIFSGFIPVIKSEVLETRWVFPPFLGYTVSEDSWLENKYRYEPDTCDLSEFLIAANVACGRKDIMHLFWENKLGVDVDDNYRIIVFEGRESLAGGVPLQSHLTLHDGPHRLSDRFLRLHFLRCLLTSAGRGDIREDYRDQEIESFMEGLGVYDNEIDESDPLWMTPLGQQVHAHLISEKIARYADPSY